MQMPNSAEICFANSPGYCYAPMTGVVKRLLC